MTSETPPGIDAAKVSAFVLEHVPSLGGPLRFSLISGGRSNLTYKVEGPGGTCVLRRPPLGHVLATAHDMAREHRVLAALADTDVPVARPLALCTDQLRIWDRPPVSASRARVWIQLGLASCALRERRYDDAAHHADRARAAQGPDAARLELALLDGYIATRRGLVDAIEPALDAAEALLATATLDADDAATTALFAELDSNDCDVVHYPDNPCWSIDLPGDWE